MRRSQHKHALPADGLFHNPKHLRADLRLVRRAIGSGWTIPPSTWADVVRRLDAILAGDSCSSMRAKIAALEVVLSAKQSQAERAISIIEDANASGPIGRP